jgi:hypothetical protein
MPYSNANTASSDSGLLHTLENTQLCFYTTLWRPNGVEKRLLKKCFQMPQTGIDDSSYRLNPDKKDEIHHYSLKEHP